MNTPVVVHTVFHHSSLFYHIIIDRQGRCIYANLLFQHTLQGGNDLFAVLLPASSRYQEILELDVRHNSPIVLETHHANGKWIQWEFSALDENSVQATGKDITHEKQNNEFAQEFELLLANTSYTIVIIDINFSIIAFNETAARQARQMMGKDLRKGASLLDIVAEAEEEVKEKLRDSVLKGIPNEEPAEITTVTGEKAFFDTLFQPAYNSKKELVAFIITARDVTERKKANDVLKLNEERWKFALEGSNQGVWDWNLLTDEVFYSPRWKQMLGLTDDDLNNDIEDWSKRLHPEDRPKVDTDIDIHLHAVNPYYENIYRLQCKDGGWKWILARGVIIEKTKDGKPLRMIGTHTDITALKQAEIDLNASRENYRQLFYYNPQPMWIYDVHTLRFLEVNEAAIKHYGYSLEEFLEMTIRDIRPVEDQASLTVRLNYIDSLPAPGFQESVWRHVKKDGKVIEVEIKSHSVEYQGHITRLVLANDITERREAAYKLAQERQLLRTLIDNLPDYVYIKDTALKTIISNEATLGQVNSGAGRPSLVIAEAQIESDKEVIQTGNAIYNLEETIRSSTGEERWMLTTKIPLKDNEDKVVGLVGISRDITERRKMQTAFDEQRLNLQRSITEATIEAQEQERTDIGKELHDNINQILTTTKLYIDMALNDEEVREELLHKTYNNISKAIEEIRTLSKALVPPSLQDIGLKEAINEMIVNLPPAAGLSVKLKTSGLHSENISASVKLMAFRIVQEQLNNIVKHAKALNAEIRLTISEKMLNIIISDDGIGFDSKKKRRGIGLSNISSRATLHKGHVEIITAPGSGCTLKVFIPL
ncbi:MAG: PAS domain S-box protein [Chitinophagaceae bacterium]